MKRRPVSIRVEGAIMTEDKQQVVGQSILSSLALKGVDIDGVTITFEEQ